MNTTTETDAGVPALATSAVVIKLPVFQKEIAVSGKLIAERDELVKASTAIAKVCNRGEYDKAGEVLADVTRLDNEIDEQRLELCRPFAKAQKDIKAKVDDALAKLRSEKKRIKDVMADWWMAEQARKCREAAERERQERKRAERELAEQQEREEQAAALGLDAPPPAEVVAQVAPVEIAPVSQIVRAPSMRVSFDLLDESKVPRAFMTFDPRKANEYIRQNKADIEKRVAAGMADEIVDGLRFTSRPDIQSRG